MDTQLKNDGHWVTVFGFPKALIREVFDKLSKFGYITDHKMPTGSSCNWFYVRYSTIQEAKKAAKHQNAELINPSRPIMIGVKLRGRRRRDHYSGDQVNRIPTTSQLLPTQQICNAPEAQAGGAINMPSNIFYVKEELVSDEEDLPPPLSISPALPKTEQVLKTEEPQNLPIFPEVMVKQTQDDGLCQPKVLLTPSPQRLGHQATGVVEAVDDRLETIGKEASVQLDENVEIGIDREERGGEMEDNTEEGEELNMTVEEEEVVIWNQGNPCYTVAKKEGHVDKLFGAKRRYVKRTPAGRPHGQRREKQANLQCDVCGYTTNWLSSLTAHLRTHTQEKPFVCDVCDFSTSHKSHLTGHKRIHTQEKPYVCEMCGFSTNWKSDLMRHMNIHSVEKPFSCDSCGRRFSQKQVLKRHMWTHSGETPYSCKECGMEFTHKSSLDRHETTQHDNNAPFFHCAFCDYSSKDKKAAKEHEICKHTKAYPHKCNLCESGFITPSKLQIHMIKKHKLQY